MTAADGPPPDAAPRRRRRRLFKGGLNGELAFDKTIDFFLIFVGLYAATAVQRCQDEQKELQEYISLLEDFRTELQTNLDEESSIERDLGSINDTKPGENLGPMAQAFDDFFVALAQDEKVVHCLHEEYAENGKANPPALTEDEIEKCHALYAKFDAAHSGEHESFTFRPAVLTPFYRYEVWQLYIADGIKIFKNKELAVNIGEIYSNARLVERQIGEIEAVYNDAFMKQVGRSAATDAELAEVVHDEERSHGMSAANLAALLHISEAVKDEHYATKEAKSILELKVERLKLTVLTMREEIEQVQGQITEELGRVKKRR
jgi:hypothetical protein